MTLVFVNFWAFLRWIGKHEIFIIIYQNWYFLAHNSFTSGLLNNLQTKKYEYATLSWLLVKKNFCTLVIFFKVKYFNSFFFKLRIVISKEILKVFKVKESNLSNEILITYQYLMKPDQRENIQNDNSTLLKCLKTRKLYGNLKAGWY